MSKLHYARISDRYDAFVRTEADVPFFVEEAKKANGDVLELMAGTGRVTIPLLRAGIAVTCVDYSPEMLARLREKLSAQNLTAEIHVMDIRYLNLNRQYQQIIIPFQAFPEITSEPDQLSALRQIYTHLDDEGLFICTLHNPVVRLKAVDGHLNLAGRFPFEQNELFVWLRQQYNPETRLVEVLEFFEEYDQHGTMQTKSFSELKFHLLEKAVFERLFQSVGFECVALYGDYDYAPFDEQTSRFMIWMLKKSSDPTNSD
jgi:SAM-dependent methyltransferase